MAVKVLLDTNIVLDVLADRAPFAEEAVMIFKLCETRQIEGVIYALSIPNLVYVMRRELEREQIGSVLQKLSAIFEIADMRAEDLRKAAALPLADFEDALQSVCAQRIKADYIVTRDIKGFLQSKVMAVKPSELLERVQLEPS